ncbi:MAG TPA: hypothetical protein VJU18_02485 [Vicinamibacteria bacterium]|nr:hypothetical protein [Vicinamibacteria bacterium]
MAHALAVLGWGWWVGGSEVYLRELFRSLAAYGEAWHEYGW